MVKIVHQNTCVNFVNSSLDNSNWDKISESLTKKSIFGGKKIVINQVLSKLWYIVQIYTIPKYIKKQVEKRIYNLLQNKKTTDFPDT